METEATAAAWAEQQVASVRDRPTARLELIDRLYHGPYGQAPPYRHLPYRRAAMSFMRWQLHRGVLAPSEGDRPGSPWWRAVNERLLRDGCEALALRSGFSGSPTSGTVDFWMSFVDRPTAPSWYRAHNASVVAGYLDHRDLAATETAPERFFMNVVLCRVLFAHALVAAPRMSLSWLRPLAPFLGDPRLGMTSIFLQLSRVLPGEYPLTGDAEEYQSDELGFGSLVDFAVIVPRLQALFAWSAQELYATEILRCLRHGSPVYAWSTGDRPVWGPSRSVMVRAVRRLLPPEDRTMRRRH